MSNRKPPIQMSELSSTIAFRGENLVLLKTLLNLLNKRMFFISKDKAEIIELLGPVYDAFSYRSECQHILPSSGDSLKAMEVVHHGIHLLTVSKFPGPMHGRLKMVRLTESIGLAIEFYLMSCLAKESPQLKLGILHYYQQIADKFGAINFEPILNQSVKNPFRYYKKMVREIDKIQMFYFDSIYETFKYSRYQTGAFAKKLKKMPAYALIASYAHFMPAINMIAYCGAKSSKKDEAQFKQCMKILDGSHSMLDFINKLGAKKYVS